MKHRTLGASGLKVSVVGLGCNNFGLRIDEAASRPVIATALDLGVNLFDTADVYGHKGGSETILGNYLGSRRKDILIATKFGNPMDEAGTLRGASRRYIMQAVEASLRRLQTDWIDVYQLHKPDPATPLEETLRALDDLIRQGKVRYVGISSCAAWELANMQWTARYHGLNRLVSCETEYNLITRDAERELVPAMRALGIGMLPYYPLASGFLTGKYKRGVAMPADARLTKGRRYAEKYLSDANFDVLEGLEAFCQRHGRSLLELAFSWLAAQPVVSSVIAGATKPAQLEANVKAADWVLSAEQLAEIDRITGAAQACLKQDMT